MIMILRSKGSALNLNPIYGTTKNAPALFPESAFTVEKSIEAGVAEIGILS